MHDYASRNGLPHFIDHWIGGKAQLPRRLERRIPRLTRHRPFMLGSCGDKGSVVARGAVGYVQTDKEPGARESTPRAGCNLAASDGILDMLPIATFVCDAAGPILQYNQRAVEIWGRAPRPGQTHDEFTAGAIFRPRRQAAAALELVRACSGPAARARVETHASSAPTAKHVVVSLNIDPLRNAKGEMIGAVNCFLDITERKRTEAALERPARTRSSRSSGWRRPTSTPPSAFRKSRRTAVSCASTRRLPHHRL